MKKHHETQYQGESDEWYTPPWIWQALGPFELDPCAPPAENRFQTIARLNWSHVEDGLMREWAGRVWLNPPYGLLAERWLARLAMHGHGTALVFARTETKWWHHHIWPHASSILFLRGRVGFLKPDGTTGTSRANAPSALVAYGEDDAAALAASKLPGVIVDLSATRKAA